MWAIMVALLPIVQSGPVSNGVDFGSCGTPGGQAVDIRRVMLLPDRAMAFDSSVGRVRISLDGQRFALHLLDAPEGDHFVGDVGDLISDGEERADVFVMIGSINARSVLYWRETYQHRSFRQGVLTVDPEAVKADWNSILTPFCEGTGGVDVLH